MTFCKQSWQRSNFLIFNALHYIYNVTKKPKYRISGGVHPQSNLERPILTIRRNFLFFFVIFVVVMLFLCC